MKEISKVNSIVECRTCWGEGYLDEVDFKGQMNKECPTCKGQGMVTLEIKFKPKQK